MVQWNYGYIIIGLFGLIASLIIKKINAGNYFDKLEYKYGKIGREKIVKVEKFVTILLSLVILIVGVIIRNLWLARIIIIISIFLCILIYILYIRIFIKSQKN